MQIGVGPKIHSPQRKQASPKQAQPNLSFEGRTKEQFYKDAGFKQDSSFGKKVVKTIVGAALIAGGVFALSKIKITVPTDAGKFKQSVCNALNKVGEWSLAAVEGVQGLFNKAPGVAEAAKAGGESGGAATVVEETAKKAVETVA